MQRMKDKPLAKILPVKVIKDHAKAMLRHLQSKHQQWFLHREMIWIVLCRGHLTSESPCSVCLFSHSVKKYCTISTYSSPLVTCDCHVEMSISSMPDMRCDNFDISSLAKIWHWEGPKILTPLFNQTPYLMVFFQLAGKTKRKYGGCYCSSLQSMKPSRLMCPSARNERDTEGGSTSV